MMATVNRGWFAIACLLIGAVGGAAGVQVVGAATQSLFINSGLLSLQADEQATFYATLDDLKSGAPAKVRMRFYDQAGVVKASKDVTLQPGQSQGIQIMGPGFFRWNAEIFETSTAPSPRRAFFGSGERLNITTQQRDPVCSLPGSGVDTGRQ
jgi:hypothetical protein